MHGAAAQLRVIVSCSLVQGLRQAITSFANTGAVQISCMHGSATLSMASPCAGSYLGTHGVPNLGAQGSATLSMAYAGALFADACLRGLNGEPGVEEYTFVESSIVPGLPFFSSRVKLGPNGAPHAEPTLSSVCAREPQTLP